MPLFPSLNPYSQKSGAGVSKTDRPVGFFRGFFSWSRMNRMMYLSLISSLIVLPLIYFFAVLAKSVDIAKFSADMEALQALIRQHEELGTEGIPTQPWTMIFIWLLGFAPFMPLLILAAVMAVLFGPVTCGLAYCFRNTVRGDHWWFSDIFVRAWKNKWQGLFFGVFDMLAVAALVCYMFMPTESFGMSEGVVSYMRIFAVSAFIIYMAMRFYIYPMIVTFNIKITKIIKNALMFTVLGAVRNIAALLSVAGVCAFLYFLPIYIPQISPLVFVMIVTFGFSFLNYISAYLTYPVLYQFMIKPALDEEAARNPNQLTIESAMSDDVTAAVKTEKTKKKSSNYGKKKK